MEIYGDEIELFINNLWGGQIIADDDKFKDMENYYNQISREKLKPKYRNTHIALLHCKSYEEIAEIFTKRERKKKPLSADAIRKRKDKVLEIIKRFMKEKYGE